MDKPTRSSPAAPAPGGPAADPSKPPTPWKRNSQLLDDELQYFTQVWLKSLPDAIKPLKCAEHYPRVLNKLAALWSLEERCIDFLDELLSDRRGERQGFSYGITGELRLLRMHRVALRATPAATPEGPETDFQATVPMPLDLPPKA